MKFAVKMDHIPVDLIAGVWFEKVIGDVDVCIQNRSICFEDRAHRNQSYPTTCLIIDKDGSVRVQRTIDGKRDTLRNKEVPTELMQRWLLELVEKARKFSDE